MSIESIDAARLIARSILKPTGKQITHGLELHKHTLVAESYSHFLQAPLNHEALIHAAQAGASPVELQDMREDMEVFGWRTYFDEAGPYEMAWDASGVNCSFVSAGEESNDPTILLKRIARYTRLFDVMPDAHGKAYSVGSIDALWCTKRPALCLSTNGVPLTGSLLNAEDELRYLPIFAQLGVCMMQLAYNRRNLIGDGWMEQANGGLSDFGRSVVKEMNRCGIIIDLSHAGWQTAIDAAKCTSKPVIISHSAVWSLCRHRRCKPDDVIRAVVESGGTVGITNTPSLLGGTGDISAMLDHIDYIADRFGVDAVTIGTSSGFSYPDNDTPSLLPHTSRLVNWENQWPEQRESSAQKVGMSREAQSMAWTNWPILTVGLVQRGYSDADVQKIIGGNLLRVANQIWNE